MYLIVLNLLINLTFIDPESKHKQLNVIMKDLQNSINQLWDDLPIDTVIASILDPRTKFFDKIPENEITIALKTLKKVILFINN